MLKPSSDRAVTWRSLRHTTATSCAPAQMTPAYFDEQYDNRARVPEFGGFLADWAARSQMVRKTAPCTIDVAYGPGPNDRLDLFYPQSVRQAGDLAPVLVFLHGGYWRALDKSDHSFVAPALTMRGALVVVVNYDLCPGTLRRPVRIPDVVLQVTRSMAWIHDHVAEFGGDPHRVVVAGHSAGGHLAAMMLACDWSGVASHIAPRWVKRAVSLSGVFDLEPLRLAPSFEASLCLDATQVDKASPARLQAPQGGRLTALVGGDESSEFLRQSHLIQKIWGRTVVPVVKPLEGLHHFSILQAVTQDGSQVVQHLTEALVRTGKL